MPELDFCMKCGTKYGGHRSGCCKPCRARKCAEPGCNVVFIPAKIEIRYCHPHQDKYRHRKYAQRGAVA